MSSCSCQKAKEVLHTRTKTPRKPYLSHISHNTAHTDYSRTTHGLNHSQTTPLRHTRTDIHRYTHTPPSLSMNSYIPLPHAHSCGWSRHTLAIYAQATHVACLLKYRCSHQATMKARQLASTESHHVHAVGGGDSGTWSHLFLTTVSHTAMHSCSSDGRLRIFSCGCRKRHLTPYGQALFSVLHDLQSADL